MANDKAKHEDIVLRLQVIQHQFQQFGAQAKALEEQYSEIETAESAITELASEQKGKSALVQVAGGVFAKATLSDFDTLLVNVGQGIIVEKSRKDVEEQVVGQRRQLEEVRELIAGQQATLLNEARRLQAMLAAGEHTKE